MQALFQQSSFRQGHLQTKRRRTRNGATGIFPPCEALNATPCRNWHSRRQRVPAGAGRRAVVGTASERRPRVEGASRAKRQDSSRRTFASQVLATPPQLELTVEPIPTAHHHHRQRLHFRTATMCMSSEGSTATCLLLQRTNRYEKGKTKGTRS